MGREDLVFIHLRDQYWPVQYNSLKESSQAGRGKSTGCGGCTKFARVQAIMVELSTEQSTDPRAGRMLSE